MNRDKLLLAIGGLLIFLGVFQPDLNWPSVSPPAVVSTVDVDAPADKELKALAEDVRDCFLNSNDADRKSDALILGSLYNDISKVISLKDSYEIVNTTEVIRQINVLSGAMLDLDIKGKYDGLSAAAEKLVTSVIGNENIAMTDELREKSVEVFQALSWACVEGSK